MLLLYAADRAALPEVRAALPRDQRVELAGSVADLGRAGRADCTIALIPVLDSGPAAALAAFKMSHPQQPVILVTEWDRENARHLKDLPVDEVVWTQEVPYHLADVVRDTCDRTNTHVRRLAATLEGAHSLPGALRRALAFACHSPRPVHSVNQLARVAGVDRRTLWQQWKSVVRDPSLRLQDFLHWILLLRAMGRKTPERSWSVVAEEIGMGLGTLSRYARQLTGRTLQEVHALGPPNLANVFRSTLFSFLLEEGAISEDAPPPPVTRPLPLVQARLAAALARRRARRHAAWRRRARR